MTTFRQHSEEQPPSNVRSPNVTEAIEFIDNLLETNDRDHDTSEWEELKKLLDEDRLSSRKLFLK